MKDNRHTQTIPSTILTQAQTKIDEAKTLLAPYLLALTPAERREVPNMGEKTIAFVEKAYDFALRNPALVPPYLEVAAFGADFSDAHGLWTLLNTVQQLEEGIGDTEMTTESGTKSLWIFVLGVLLCKTPRHCMPWCSTSPSKWPHPRTSPARKPSTRNSRPASPNKEDDERRAAPVKPNSPCRAGRGTAGIQSPDTSIRTRMGSTKSPGGSTRSGTHSIKRRMIGSQNPGGSMKRRTGSIKR
jgi:hypothetical protein